MLAASASLLNIPVVILDVGAHAPAKQVVAPSVPDHAHVDGSFSDPDKIRELAAKVDILTVEIEHVNVDVLEEVQVSHGVEVHPNPSTIRIIQDKFRQKEHLLSHALPVAQFLPVDPTDQGIRDAAAALGLPLMLKSRTLAYDGRGNHELNNLSEISDALHALRDRPLYAEKWVPFVKEIAVMVVRTTTGDTFSYPVVETIHEDNICHVVLAPLRSRDAGLSERASRIAERAVKSLSGAGVFGVEMFLLRDGQILINEIAPRPHNSGHYTIEACVTSQYENHLRAILALPIGSTALKVLSAAMVNIIGASNDMSELTKFAKRALAVSGASVHLYGKAECRKGRKMGHVTLTANSDAERTVRLRELLQHLPGSGINNDDEEYDMDELHFGEHAPAWPRPDHSHEQPLVGVIMGSDSDFPVMLPAARILERFHLPYELTIVSAHRTPDRLIEYSRSAAARGLRVIVAGAGGAAHLPGMVAAMTGLPVIGVPVKGSALDGVDSLHSMVQMPRGIPVATVAINNGTNAGLLAVRILSAGKPSLVQDMEHYMKDLENEVLDKVVKLEEEGWEHLVMKCS